MHVISTYNYLNVNVLTMDCREKSTFEIKCVYLDAPNAKILDNNSLNIKMEQLGRCVSPGITILPKNPILFSRNDDEWIGGAYVTRD